MGESQWSTTNKPQPPSSDKAPSGGGGEGGKPPNKKAGSNPGFGGFSLEGHYAECYPGMAEEYDATYDSDDEADYTKMDMVGGAFLEVEILCM